MRVLTFESPDKLTRKIEVIPDELAPQALRDDYGWHEVIDASSQHTVVRAFFDIDAHSDRDPLAAVLRELNTVFSCADDDWAISDGSRYISEKERKISYHIMSKRFCITLENLRSVSFAMHRKLPVVDCSVICISLMANHELLFLRLPNQHKGLINKSGPPMRVIQGELADFIVTRVDKLTEFRPVSNT